MAATTKPKRAKTKEKTYRSLDELLDEWYPTGADWDDDVLDDDPTALGAKIAHESVEQLRKELQKVTKTKS